MKNLCFFLLILLSVKSLSAQTNIQQSLSVSSANTTADPSAQLDVSATDKGFLLPRLTTAQRTAIPAPAPSLLVFDTDTKSFWYVAPSATSGQWKELTMIAGLSDEDGDTRIQVEESPDEDIVRFDLGGAEKMVLRKNANGTARLELIDLNLSTIIGQDAGVNNNPLMAQQNTFVGYASGMDNATGSFNTFLGSQAGRSNTSGFSNVGVGFKALHSNQNRPNLVAVGDSALYNNGLGAMVSNHAVSNTALGSKALFANTLGWNNTASGKSALFSNTNGNSNTANGALALFGNTVGSSNAAFGTEAMFSNTNGSYNTSNGALALYANTSGSYNSATGNSAMYGNTSGANNSAHGYLALRFNTTGNGNVAMGASALYNNATASSNIAIGNNALYNNTDRSNLVAVGDSALYNNGVGASQFNHSKFNTALGSKALFANTIGAYNTANGHSALYSNNAGIANTAIGYRAMYLNTSGGANTACGTDALYSNTTGSHNTVTGWEAMYLNSTGQSNTADGREALLSNTSGNYNTAIGMQALYSNTTGNQNTAIGYQAGFSLNNLTNTACLGYDAGGVNNASNRIEIGNTYVTWIGGVTGWFNYSDATIKDQVKENVPGMAFISRLRPVTYHLNIHRLREKMAKPDTLDWEGKYDIEKMQMTGFLAQEVEQAAQELGYDFSGVDQPAGEHGVYSLNYSQFVVPIVKAVQEQQTVLVAQTASMEALQAENATLKSQLSTLSGRLDSLMVVLQNAGFSLER